MGPAAESKKGKLTSCVWAWACLALAAGCCGSRTQLDRALLAEGGAAVRCEGLAEQYQVACPDVLEITVAGAPELPSPQAVGPDGRLDLGPLGRLRVEGQTVGTIAAGIAAQARVAVLAVQVRVVEHNSQKVYLFGEGSGLQRAVAFRGPETVLDLLQRTGGIKAGAAPDEVFVVRSRVPDGVQPEVFPIKLDDILMKKDLKTNIRLEPFDQVFVGETGKACLGKHMPPFFLPLYRAMCGMCRPNKGAPPPNLEEAGKTRKPFIFRLPAPLRKDKPHTPPETPTELPPPRRV